jgi:Peptidase A4 family
MQLRVRLFGGVAVAALGSASLLLAGAVASAVAASGPGARLDPSVGQMLPAPLPPGAATAPAVRGYSKIGSFNWSGYAQGDSGGTYKAVRDTWTVPTVNTQLAGNQYSADWVGIGGLRDSTLVQAGTEADNIGGTARYDAWTEILPAAEVVIPGLTIKPGNKIMTTVEEIKAGTWTMTVDDLSTGKSGGKTVTYSSSGASAEAVHERPCITDGCTSTSDLATLSHTTNVRFDPGDLSTAAPGTFVWDPLLTPAKGATLDEIIMVNNSGTAHIATPSKPDSDSDGFTVAYGSKPPPPPKS